MEAVIASGLYSVGAHSLLLPGTLALPNTEPEMLDAIEVLGEEPGVLKRFGSVGIPDAAMPVPR